MGGIIDKITDFIKEMLQGWVLDNLGTMFTDVNDKVGTIAREVSKTPSTWNSGIFSMVRTLSENVVIPIAGLIISFVLIYELITMVIDKNNMHDAYFHVQQPDRHNEYRGADRFRSGNNGNQPVYENHVRPHHRHFIRAHD